MKKLSFFIAGRYFFSKKKKSFINILSIFSMVAVAVGTMALIVVLSVFNGLEGLIRSLYNSFDPDLQISLTEGKFFQPSSEIKNQISSIEGVADMVYIVEDNVLLRYDGGDAVVRMKGVNNESNYKERLSNNISEGSFKLTQGENNFAVIGRGIRYQLGINTRNDFLALQLYYPKRIEPGISNPSRLYSSGLLKPAGVFAIEKQYDEKYIFVPLSFAQKLIEKENSVTAIEVILKQGASLEAVQKKLQDVLGERFKILNSDQQHASLLKAIKIEKLFVYLTFSFILAVASFTIYFCLTMLVLDKKKDISIMKALGFDRSKVRNIFLFEGAIISFTGAIVGAGLGFTLCLLQQEFGFISMGMASAVQEAYPVKMIASDFIFTMITIIVITFLASIQPALKAQKIEDINRL